MAQVVGPNTQTRLDLHAVRGVRLEVGDGVSNHFAGTGASTGYFSIDVFESPGQTSKRMTSRPSYPLNVIIGDRMVTVE
jgi:hypothetical protein